MKKLIGMLAIVLIAGSLSFAQVSDRSANSDQANGPAATLDGGHGRNNNWGWIGLLGLAGLGGLRGRRQSSTSERDRDVTNIRRAA